VRVLVAGAHGKTARRLTRMLVEDGHEVRGLVRKEEQTGDIEADGAEPVLVDLEAEEVEGGVGRAVEGCDAIVFAAGAGPGSGDAREESYLMLSAMGAINPEGGSEGMRPYLRAKARADERLEKSGLDYTIIRPGSLTEDEGTGDIEAAGQLGRRGEIPREDVARTFAAALEDENTYHKTFEILSGDTPIREALAQL
jgi:uncharacterized protein YbjT (DUF2867 family)